VEATEEMTEDLGMTRSLQIKRTRVITTEVMNHVVMAKEENIIKPHVWKTRLVLLRRRRTHQ